MPLLILSGYPSCGKSTYASHIKAFFEDKIASGSTDLKAVDVVDDERLHIEKDKYNDRETEKIARGAQMAAVKRNLSPQTLVILDNMSYIKGFRYQLYCEAKSHSTNYCVVHIGATREKCIELNSAKDRADPWRLDLLESLIFRYEEPNSMSRWDSPLFITPFGENLPLQDIYDVLVLAQPMKPNSATAVKAQVPTSYLETLNSTTKDIIQQVVELHRDAPGARVVVAGRDLQLPLNLTLPSINRARRNFIQLNKTGGMPIDNIATFFVEFLNQNMLDL